MNAVTPVDVLPERPYPGLRPFRQEEWPIFFGREEHADEVIVGLGRQGLVLVHGASGCGKSSLVRAGVLPALEASHEVAGRMWRTATMRPSEGLLSRLAEILEESLPRPAGEGDAEDAGAGPSSWADFVVKGGGLVDHVEQAVRISGGGGFCLLIDQFEEIFRWARERSEAEARLFVDFLKRVGGNGEETGFYVILTMRSDYFGQCASYDGFAEFLNPRQYLLPRMDEFGLLRAIYEPAELYGGAIDPAVSAMLLPVVEGHVDGLPVLQHALMRASHHAQARAAPGAPWRVTAEDLAQAGGADHALAQHADEVLEQATGGDPELVEAAEWIFRALTDLDADRRAIRRPCRLSGLIEVSGVDRERTLAIIDAFRAPDCSFIFPYLPTPIDDESELDISHEALIRQWPRLCNTGIDSRTSRPNGWVYREFHDSLVWRSLVVQATAYAEDRNHLLSVATTEQRLPWFRAIEARPGWTKRHALSERRGDAASTDEQWRNVKAMMDASGQNLARQQGIIGRLRRVRNGSLLLVVLALAALVALSVFYVIDSKRKHDALLQKQVELVRQSDFERRQRVAAFAMARIFAERTIDQLCSQSEGANASGVQTCRAEVERQLWEEVKFQTGLGREVSAPPSPAAVSQQPEPARGAPKPGGGQR